MGENRDDPKPGRVGHAPASGSQTVPTFPPPAHMAGPVAGLPVAQVLEPLGKALQEGGTAVLHAPPGAGKSTLVPLFLAGRFRGDGRILVLEPRRLAARALAERMAWMLGEKPGLRVGYRVRGHARVSASTRVEVVTEGILTRMIQDDPALAGVSCVIFDEFHERSLQADLGLALALEARAVLRPDLALVVMSATLDVEPVAALMGGAPVIRSDGTAFPVRTHWLARPVDPALSHEAAVAALVRHALQKTEGAMLVFLPGEREIRRVASLLAPVAGIAVRPLHGSMPLSGQRAALGPASGRKVILATAIAQTSLTIPDIRVVVDGGRVRRARFDPASGMTRLVTERVSRAEAEQRRGRAGRVAEGQCFRLWTRGEEGPMAAFPPPEIETADLASLALELALWGSESVPLPTRPDAARMSEARALLAGLDALGPDGRVTAHGRRLAALPLHPRLAHMICVAGAEAAPLAALVSARDPLPDSGADLALRLERLRTPTATETDRDALAPIRAEAARLARAAPRATRPGLSLAQMAALAYPDRIGLRREGDAPRYLLSGGRGASLADRSALGSARMLVATDLDGDRREARIRQAIAISATELREVHPDLFHEVGEVFWSARAGRVIARRCEKFAALVLSEQPWPDAPEEARARAALDGLRAAGLPWTPQSQRLRDRIALVREADWPAVDDMSMLDGEGAEPLLRQLGTCRTRDDLRAIDLAAVLRALVGPGRMSIVEHLAPEHFVTPTGRRVPISYEGDTPSVALRLQEMFGTARHPVVGARHVALRLTLLSPADRPLQVTSDLPGFWAGAYAEVRKEMRARYPRHPWPEDPANSEPARHRLRRGGRADAQGRGP